MKNLIKVLVRRNSSKSKKHKITKLRMYEKLEPEKFSMQVDFAEMIVMNKGVPKKVIVFCAKLSYGKGKFIKVYPIINNAFINLLYILIIFIGFP
ncbi:transposase [Clostridium pasteurianum DSM 525 = ATCC 6013]|uniref:Transposase n=2 Tax=Clostridium pasteurianum TaxID=1501 RepID=A0A0H3J3T5_CLOPA|nr:hypothetical protein [Clostridium pasteurianum]AJA46573.1 transposase [Clostridium pasteurianum DSM 525 = ATCC 6013]AJA50561.1 transposase [Clostridium pasteurianum DSM 525 = ATCC 6013]KRU13427.1 hypothetical protein CP6013_02675 [Clostridium pasteurianum DSM 525 = ATCC 6013]